MRRVARAERLMVARHPDIEPFFAQRCAAITAKPGRGLGAHIVRRFPHRPRIRASAFLAYERRLAGAFLSAWDEPAVDPAAYDEAYYRGTCGGSDTWDRTGGAELHALYAGSLRRAALVPGEVLVDLGTGRGDLLAAALQAGAARAVGVEYSPDAVRLAQRTLEVHAAGAQAEVILADARAVPLTDDFADLVTLLDVVEHLTEPELAAVLAEARRILRPGGRVLIHTLPTRTLYDITYRFQRRLTPRRLRTWPRDPRNDFERRMHVGEQTVRSLRRALRAAGFADVSVKPGQWVHDGFVPDERARRLYGRLAAVPITRRLGAADLWATARHREDRSTR